MEFTIRTGAASDSGLVRESNEDSYAANHRVFVVADGMGGHQAGEVASALAITTLLDRLGEGAESMDVVVAAVVEANAAIFHGAHTKLEQRGMGTTVTGMVILPGNDQRDSTMAMFNVGDSRAYLWRDNSLRRATIDHSYVQELVATGHITEDEARHHPRRNIVTRALGIEPHVRVDTWQLRPHTGDRYILCSDGLVDEVTDADIAAIVMANDDPQVLSDALVAKANANGGRDNTTVVVVDILEGYPPNGNGDGELLGSPLWAGADEPSLVDADPPTDQLPATLAPVAAAPPPPSGRTMTLKLFLIGLAVAAALTVGITLLAVALSGDDTPDTPDTTETTVDDSAPTTTRRSTTTTRLTTTTQPTTTSGATTSQP
jgi:protein phosphatase